MKIAYFDCHCGAAGDMLNAALLSAGLDEKLWLSELNKIALPQRSFSIKVSDVMRCHIAAKKMDVLDSSGVKFDELYELSLAQSAKNAKNEHHHHDHKHHHDHDHGHRHHDREHPDHDHQHDHDQDYEHHHDHEHGQDQDHDQDHDHEHHHDHEQDQDQDHDHEHHHDHEQDQDHDHKHSHTHDQVEHSHGPGRKHSHPVGQSNLPAQEARHLSEILRLIERSTISARAKDLSSRIFMRLAAAESRVHGVPPEAVHFHEVGAVDAIVDIVGFSIGYDLLGIDRSYCSAVAVGSGRVRTEHGVYPVPGPATLNLLTEAGASLADSEIPFECLTPTGAAILCEVASDWGKQPALDRVICAGYGAGTKDPERWPNVCRVVLGQVGDAVSESSAQFASTRFPTETIAVIEANVDDSSPQTLAFAMERLFECGALDVTVIPALMKKGRSGQVLTVLCKPADKAKLQELVLLETTSIGVRSYNAQRLVADRKWESVTLKSGGNIRIKLALDNTGMVINAQPEFEDCAQFARTAGIPLKDVMAEAMLRYRLRGDGG